MTRTLALCAGRNQDPRQFINIREICGCTDADFITVDDSPEADPHIIANISSVEFISSLESASYDYIAFIGCPFMVYRDFDGRYNFELLRSYISKLKPGGVA